MAPMRSVLGGRTGIALTVVVVVANVVGAVGGDELLRGRSSVTTVATPFRARAAGDPPAR